MRWPRNKLFVTLDRLIFVVERGKLYLVTNEHFPNPARTFRFEQSISAELLDAGVAVAHLPDVTFRHVGAGQSAYEANGMRRPWD